MKNLDVRVLAVLRELQRTANVSHAAQNLGLSQSAVSMSLARLRRHFNDPLFVRTSRGMEPTPYAEGLLVELKEASERLESALGHRPKFDPATSDRMFHLVTADLSQITILPPLAKRLAEIAPFCPDRSQVFKSDLPRLLESGEADLAVAMIPQMGAGFCQQRFFASKFHCAVRAGHPRVKGRSYAGPIPEGEPHLRYNLRHRLRILGKSPPGQERSGATSACVFRAFSGSGRSSQQQTIWQSCPAGSARFYRKAHHSDLASAIFHPWLRGNTELARTLYEGPGTSVAPNHRAKPFRVSTPNSASWRAHERGLLSRER